MATVSLQANNRIWLTYRHFPYKAWNAVAELVDNSTQSYTDNRVALRKQLKKDHEPFAVRIDYSKGELFSIYDNAMGMDLKDLARAVQLAAPPPNTSGRSEFGMGMKTSCCWLGNQWKIVTTKLGATKEYSVTIDVEQIAKSSSQDLVVQEKPADRDEHYTRLEIAELFPRLLTRALSKTKENLVEMFRQDIRDGTLQLYWGGELLEPPVLEPLVTNDGGQQRKWHKKIKFTVDGLKVEGTIGILGEGFRGRDNAGFDLLRRGRVILGRPVGYRPRVIFGEARNDLLNQRLYGELHLDDFPVNHLKDDFLWDGREDEFQQKLKEKGLDYIHKARSYRPTKEKAQTVSETVIKAANEEMAEELSEEEMVEQITIVETTPVPDEPDPAVLEAKAAKLRAQKLDPRIVEVGKNTFRIYHPEGMSESEPYFLTQSAEENAIDIFINDNHPFVAARATDESDFVMFVRWCVMDAIVEHALLHAKGTVTATFPARLKDQLLRGIKV